MVSVEKCISLSKRPTSIAWILSWPSIWIELRGMEYDIGNSLHPTFEVANFAEVFFEVYFKIRSNNRIDRRILVANWGVQ